MQWLIIPFMFAAGVNFALFWHVGTGNVGKPLRDTEFRSYAAILGTPTALVATLLFVDTALAAIDAPGAGGTVRIAGDTEAALRHGAFQVVSIVTTTGYASIDFNQWGGSAQSLLVVAMFIGGSAGSTGGGIKVVRWVVVAKSIQRELFGAVHPEAVRPVRLGGRALDEDAVRGIHAFTLLYVGLFLLGALALAVDAARTGGGLSVVEAITASASTIGNIGPGLGQLGPIGSYLEFPASSKLLMVGMMWIGRLEIFPVLVLLTRGYWRS